MTDGDWTTDPATNRKNTSATFKVVAEKIADMIRDDAALLLRGDTLLVAQCILAHLAHVHGFAPQQDEIERAMASQCTCGGIKAGRACQDTCAIFTSGHTPIKRLKDERDVFKAEAARLDLAMRSEQDRNRLWAHCVSQHANILPPETPLAEMQSYHDGEHRGPGTIRDHDPADRSYSLKKLGEVLSEAEDGSEVDETPAKPLVDPLRRTVATERTTAPIEWAEASVAIVGWLREDLVAARARIQELERERPPRPAAD
jgi:hypothetical protein